MLCAIIILVTFIVSSNPAVTKPEEFTIGEAQYRSRPLDTNDLSKVDLNMADGGQKELKREPSRPRPFKGPWLSGMRKPEPKPSRKTNVGILSERPRGVDNSVKKDGPLGGEREKRKSGKIKRDNLKKRAERNTWRRREKDLEDINNEVKVKSNFPRRTRPRVVMPALSSFNIATADGSAIRLSKHTFPGVKVFLIVNTASESELATQFTELEQLWNEYRDKGLQIIAFPSNSFNQEPLTDNEIQTLMRKTYGVTYPVMAKCDVTGDETIDLYKWLTKNANRDGKVPKWAPLAESGLKRSDVQWNFDKFLVYNRRDGQVIMRFAYDSPPLELGKFVERGLLIHERAKMEL